LLIDNCVKIVRETSAEYPAPSSGGWPCFEGNAHLDSCA
jgi:hypothetical protein